MVVPPCSKAAARSASTSPLTVEPPCPQEIKHATPPLAGAEHALEQATLEPLQGPLSPTTSPTTTLDPGPSTLAIAFTLTIACFALRR